MCVLRVSETPGVRASAHGASLFRRSSMQGKLQGQTKPTFSSVCACSSVLASETQKDHAGVRQTADLRSVEQHTIDIDTCISRVARAALSPDTR